MCMRETRCEKSDRDIVHNLVTLEPFAESHLQLLSIWLHRPHLARWYPNPEENVAWAANPPEGGAHALIACEARPVGYIRWQVVDRETLDSVGLHRIPTNAVDADLLLGEAPYVGRALGPLALEVLVAQLQANTALPLVGLTSSIANVHAHRAFEKAGFSIWGQYSPGTFGPCHLFVRSLKREHELSTPTTAPHPNGDDHDRR